MSISESVGGPEKTRGGLANTPGTWTGTEIGETAASETVSVTANAIATGNIVGERMIEETDTVDDLHLEIIVHPSHPMVTLTMPMTIQTEKKASEYQSNSCMNHLSCRFPRISPTHSPRPASPTPSTRAPSEATHFQKPVQPPAPPQPDQELDLEVDTAAAEEAVRAARRARRQAILARDSGVASANKSISPSHGPSSAVQPPQPVASVSDTLQSHSVVDTSTVSTMNTSSARQDSISTFLYRHNL